jgi:hypothetical protein
MRYITIATIDGKMFRNMETSAKDVDRAETIATILLKNKYVGEIEIIRTVEKSAWKKMVKNLK